MPVEVRYCKHDFDEHSLPEDLKRFAEAQSKRGYSAPSEYIRELIREGQKRKAKEEDLA